MTNGIGRTAMALAVAALVSAAGAAAAWAQEETIPTADARDFLGNWSVAIDGDAGPIDVRLSITDRGGRLAVAVTSGADDAGNRVVQSVAKDGASLTIVYTLDMQGQSLPVVLTLTPDGDEVHGSLDLGGGIFTASGPARRVES